jgi:hypothetical protein
MLFIDANIYLRFYDSSQSEYKKLLKTMVEVKDAIFITEQLVSEVNRNKLTVFQSSCTDVVMDDAIKKRHLAEHFDPTENAIIKEWNKKRDALEKESQKLVKEKTAIYDRLLSEISISKDEVSKELHKIFSSAKAPTHEQIQRANDRKRIGNPPGKPQDPLGDQLSWEQFLENISETTHIWIISNDSDYFSAYKDKCYLNPFLSLEIINAAMKMKTVKCFNKLAIGLKDFNDHLSTKLASLPNADELKEISKFEILPSLTGYASGSMGTSPTYSGIQNDQWITRRQPQCPSCRSVYPIIGPVIRVVGTGVFSDIFVCQTCGNQWEEIRSSD